MHIDPFGPKRNLRSSKDLSSAVTFVAITDRVLAVCYI